jgi:antitoxin HicB
VVEAEAIAWQLERAMKKQKTSKKRLAELMETSRSQIDRILDPTSKNVTIATLKRVAKIVGRELRVELVWSGRQRVKSCSKISIPRVSRREN